MSRRPLPPSDSSSSSNAPAPGPTVSPAAGAGSDAPLSSAGLAALDELMAEVVRGKGRSKSSLDVVRLRPLYEKLRGHLSPDPSTIRAGAPDELPAYRLAFGQAFLDVEAAVQEAGRTIHGNRRFSQRARQLSEKGAKVHRRVCGRVVERVPASEVELRSEMGADAGVTARYPLKVYDGLVLQLAACQKPEFVPVLVAAGLHPDEWAKAITEVVGPLGEAVHAGTQGAVTVGENTSVLDEALLRLDVTLQRAAVWLEDFVSEEAAQALEADIPRHHETAAQTEPGSSGQSETEPQQPPAGDAATPSQTERPQPATPGTTASASAGESTSSPTPPAVPASEGATTAPMA